MKKLWYKKFDKMVDHLWKNRKTIRDKYNWYNDWDDGTYEQAKDVSIEFDYPDYCGLPKKISDTLTGDFVDIAQECITEMILSKTKASMKRKLKDAIKEHEGYEI